MRLGVHNCVQKFFLPLNNPSVERCGQRNRRADYHQLLKASPALVRRRRSSRRVTPHWEFVDYVPDPDPELTLLLKTSENIICKLFANNTNGELATLHSIATEQLHLSLN